MERRAIVEEPRADGECAFARKRRAALACRGALASWTRGREDRGPRQADNSGGCLRGGGGCGLPRWWTGECARGLETHFVRARLARGWRAHRGVGSQVSAAG